MEKHQLQNIAKGFFVFLFGLIDISLILRFILKLIGASTSSSFVAFVYEFSQSFYEPFAGTLKDFDAQKFVIEINTVIGILVIFLAGFVVYKVIEGAFQNTGLEIFAGLLDAFFNFLEVILGLRLLFKLLNANQNTFIKFLYTLSDIFYQPFEGLIKSIVVNNYVFETATLIAIILIVIVDIISEKLFKKVNKPGQAVVYNVPKREAVSAPASPEINIRTSTPTQQITTPAPKINISQIDSTRPTTQTMPNINIDTREVAAPPIQETSSAENYYQENPPTREENTSHLPPEPPKASQLEPDQHQSPPIII